jgi:hypothetical protein
MDGRQIGPLWWLGSGIICNCGVPECVYSTLEAKQAWMKAWLAILYPPKPPAPWWKFWERVS